ncbi:IS110 family transposase [Xanthomonas theicola]|uniref:Transposase IS110-like N-terminal domain-containing protein n=1 Tax=Xanthomonas theicola TaxID=56464 RepID=A0A2S6ZCE8_9XANT|nr:hypothetical protein XthCFBP4691_15110 [Xanthomonas theicola]
MCGRPTGRSVRARVGARAAAHRPRCLARTVERAFAQAHKPGQPPGGSLLQRLCDHRAGQCVGNVLLEATGGYERAVMMALAMAGIPVTRINPRRARAFATALGKTTKTDPPALLARMAQRVQAPAPVPDPLREQLRMPVQRREQLVQQPDDERRRLHQATLVLVRESLIEQIGSVRRQLQWMNQATKQLRPPLDDALEHPLSAVPGIGEVTTASLRPTCPSWGRWIVARSRPWRPGALQRGQRATPRQTPHRRWARPDPARAVHGLLERGAHPSPLQGPLGARQTSRGRGPDANIRASCSTLATPVALSSAPRPNASQCAEQMPSPAGAWPVPAWRPRARA